MSKYRVVREGALVVGCSWVLCWYGDSLSNSRGATSAMYFQIGLTVGVMLVKLTLPIMVFYLHERVHRGWNSIERCLRRFKCAMSQPRRGRRDQHRRQPPFQAHIFRKLYSSILWPCRHSITWYFKNLEKRFQRHKYSELQNKTYTNVFRIIFGIHWNE